MARHKDRTECVFPPRGETEEPECPHERVRRLGQDAGYNVYDRCQDCDSVVVTFRSNDDWKHVRKEKETRYERNWNPLLNALQSDQLAEETDNSTSIGRSLRGRIRGILDRIRMN